MSGPATSAAALPRLDPPPRIAVVLAPYYAQIAEWQLAGAMAVLEAAGATTEILRVPGSLEIPPAISMAAGAAAFEGYVALGCVIRGETTHYETVCEESARGITLLGIGAATGRPVAIGNGILTCETLAQAEDRADPARQDKGGGAARAALELVALARGFGLGPGHGPAPAPPEAEAMMAAGLSRTA